jgi:uncharacterized protein Usg
MKPFSWSWSKLKNYRTCPKRHYEIDIAKSFKEAESEQLKWGNLVHDSMAKFIEKHIPLPPTVKRYSGWPTNVSELAKVGIVTKVENKLAMDKAFSPTDFFAADSWFRGVIDVLMLLPEEHRSAITIDWKTGGKVNPEFEQLGLSAQLIFAHYPEIDHVLTIYVWLGHDTHTVKIYSRGEMLEFWNDLWPTVLDMDHAWRTTTYPAKPSGLCKNYCPVTSCPYHGKGSH